MKPFYQEWAESLGITQPENGTWIQAISTHLGATKENGTFITGLTKKLNLWEGGRTNMQRRIREHRNGTTPTVPTPPTEPVVPPAPTKSLTGGLYETPVGTYNTNQQPLYGLYNYSLSYVIIRAVELPALELIGSIQFQLSGYSSGYLMPNQVIKMAHTNNTNLGSTTYANNYNGATDMRDLTTVYSGDITYATGWNEVIFQNNFEWNGTDNILIIFENRSGKWKSGYGWGEGHAAGTQLSAYAYVDSVFPADTTTNIIMSRTTTRLNIKLGY